MAGRPRRRSAIVRLVVVALAIGACTTCSRPTETAGNADVEARVTRWLQDLEADEATATRAATALIALGPADAAAVPILMAALACPPEPPSDDDHARGEEPHAHAHGEDGHHPAHDAASSPHGDHVHTGCNDHTVLTAASALGGIGAAAVPSLLAMVRDGDETNRTFAGYALNRMNPTAAPALIAALDGPEPRLRLAIMGAIRSLQPPPPDALPAIAARLGDVDTEVRMQAADTLGHFGAAAVPTLVPAFDDPEPRVRASVASALRFVGPPARSAAPTLVARLGDEAASVRLNAAAALAAIGAHDPATIAALARTLDDRDHTVRWGAAMALGRLGPAASAAAPALTRARSDVHPLVRAAATDALRRIN